MTTGLLKLIGSQNLLDHSGELKIHTEKTHSIARYGQLPCYGDFILSMAVFTDDEFFSLTHNMNPNFKVPFEYDYINKCYYFINKPIAVRNFSGYHVRYTKPFKMYTYEIFSQIEFRRQYDSRTIPNFFKFLKLPVYLKSYYDSFEKITFPKLLDIFGDPAEIIRKFSIEKERPLAYDKIRRIFEYTNNMNIPYAPGNIANIAFTPLDENKRPFNVDEEMEIFITISDMKEILLNNKILKFLTGSPSPDFLTFYSVNIPGHLDYHTTLDQSNGNIGMIGGDSFQNVHLYIQGTDKVKYVGITTSILPKINI